jgi:hypothetical protein
MCSILQFSISFHPPWPKYSYQHAVPKHPVVSGKRICFRPQEKCWVTTTTLGLLERTNLSLNSFVLSERTNKVSV